MKPILVHVHVYYDYLWDELSQCIKNISGYSYDLYVTLPEGKDELQKKIKAEYPDCVIRFVPNLGFDIGPFVEVIKSVNLSDYSYVIKLHTKRDILRRDSLFWFYGARWRNALLGFIRSTDSFHHVINLMESEPKIGMHGPSMAIINKYSDDNKAYKATADFISSHNLPKRNYSFVGGAMFVVRSEVLNDVLALNLSLNDFQDSDQTHNTCQLAHMIERFFGYAVYSQGYIIADCTTNPVISKLIVIANVLRRFIFTSVFSFRVTRKNKFLVKFLHIPVLAIPLKKKQ